MNPIDAVRLMVKHYPGGVDALAVLTGKASETLRKELAGAAGYKLGVADACSISEACITVNSEHCHAYANSVAANCGGFVKLDVRHMDAPPTTMDQRIAKFVQETSDVVSAVLAAKADGRYTPNELKAIHKEIMEAADALLLVEQGAEEAAHLRAVHKERA